MVVLLGCMWQLIHYHVKRGNYYPSIMNKILNDIIEKIEIVIESSKLFFALTGLLAILVTYNYLTNKPVISIEKYDSFVAVKMDLFYGLLRNRDENKFNKIHKIESIFKKLQVPLCDDSYDPDGRYIVFPQETKRNKNLVALWKARGEKERRNFKPLTDEQMQNNHYKAALQEAGYGERDFNISTDSKFYLENIGNPLMFFESLQIPVIEKYKYKQENYYENVFKLSDNYSKDIFKETLDEIDDIGLKTDILDSFNGSRQLWTPFVITNTGDAIAKDIQIIFQPGNVYGIYELVFSNLDHQGIIYYEENKESTPYILNAKSILLQIPVLKPKEVKIVVVKSSSMLPGNEILRVKDYTGEEINKRILGYLILAFFLLSVVYCVMLLISNNKNRVLGQ